MKRFILLGLLLGTSVFAIAQKKTKPLEAKITYEINYEELPEMLEPYRAMLPKEMITYMKDSKLRIEQTTMGVVTVNVTDSEKKTGFMLMDQFGEKTAYTLSKEDMEAESTNGAENNEITYTSETKEIAGYKCTKVEIKSKADESVSFAWVTEEIKATSKAYSYLKGFPLEYSVHTSNDMTIEMKVKTLEKIKVSDDFFIIPKDYTQKPMSDLQKQMEGLQNDSEKE